MSDLAYRMATEIYKQGLECDAAAGFIRSRLDGFLGSVVEQVKASMGRKYDKEKERGL